MAELSPLEQAAANLDQPAGAWLDAYLDLKAAGLPWKKAAFAAWFSAPKSTRQPGTMKELAALLNLKSEQVFYKWQQQAWFKDSGVDKLRQLIFQKYIGDVDRKSISEALNESGAAGVAARRLFYEQAKLATGPVEVDVPVDSNFERVLRAAYGGAGAQDDDSNEDA